MVHSPPYENWDLTLSIGNTLAFEACLRTLLSGGDSILMEEYAYTSSVFATRSNDILTLLTIDHKESTSLEYLWMDKVWEQIFSTNDYHHGKNQKDGNRGLHILFRIPPSHHTDYRTGQNPSGASMFLERRKDLYAVFQKHDILIIEDEPYCKSSYAQS